MRRGRGWRQRELGGGLGAKYPNHLAGKLEGRADVTLHPQPQGRQAPVVATGIAAKQLGRLTPAAAGLRKPLVSDSTGRVACTCSRMLRVPKARGAGFWSQARTLQGGRQGLGWKARALCPGGMFPSSAPSDADKPSTRSESSLYPFLLGRLLLLHSF